jgi:hypothetical protein
MPHDPPSMSRLTKRQRYLLYHVWMSHPGSHVIQSGEQRTATSLVKRGLLTACPGTVYRAYKLTPTGVEAAPSALSVRERSIEHAREVSERTGIKHVVREDHGTYLVLPLYREGREGREHDPGFAALGLLVKESL